VVTKGVRPAANLTYLLDKCSHAAACKAVHAGSIQMCAAPPQTQPVAVPALSATGSWTLAVLAVLVLWLGIDPTPLVRLLQSTVTHLS